MKLNRCGYCGSNKIKADRALAGKLFCLTCGRTLSNKPHSKFEKIGNYKIEKVWYYFLLLILVLIIVVSVN